MPSLLHLPMNRRRATHPAPIIQQILQDIPRVRRLLLPLLPRSPFSRGQDLKRGCVLADLEADLCAGSVARAAGYGVPCVVGPWLGCAHGDVVDLGLEIRETGVASSFAFDGAFAVYAVYAAGEGIERARGDAVH